MNGLQAVESWREYFGEPKGATLGLFNAAYPIGALCALPFVSIVSDGFGRKRGLALGAAVCILGATLQAAAASLPMFVVARGIIGAGTVLTSTAGAPLITEVAHPAHRTTATALFNTSWSLGAIIAAWATFGTFRITDSAAWRIPSALQGLPSVIQLCALWFVPESPRWLISKGRPEEALHILGHYHAEGDENDPVVQFEFREITETIAHEKSLKNTKFLNKYSQFFRTRGNRHRLAILVWLACCSQMSGNAFISYYLSPVLTSIGITTSLQQTLINATQQMLSWFSALYFATLSQKLGRRTLFLIGLLCILTCLIAITAGSAEFAKNSLNKSAGYTVLAFLYLFSPAYNFGLNGNLGLYVTEILSYNLRMPGLAVFQFAQICFSILSTFAVPVGLEKMAWHFYLVFVPWVVVEFAGVWLLCPETKGPSLEEIQVIFDGIHDTGLEDLKDRDVEDGVPAIAGEKKQIETTATSVEYASN